MQHDPGLMQAPRCAVYWKWKGVGTLLSTYRPLWTDNLLAKRRRTAYGGPEGSPMGLRMQPREREVLHPHQQGGKNPGRWSNGWRIFYILIKTVLYI